jgi:hypothetical protein
VLAGLIQEADGPPIEYATQMGDTGLDSICVAYFIGELQQFYGLGDALYKMLVAANRPILQVRVSDLVEFIARDTSKAAAAPLEGAA